jgi:hypothetical protein
MDTQTKTPKNLTLDAVMVHLGTDEPAREHLEAVRWLRELAESSFRSRNRDGARTVVRLKQVDGKRLMLHRSRPASR